jgi:hypothetical protein
MPEFELPNPKELEERRTDTFAKRTALITAVYAVVLAIAALGGSNATKEMLLAQQQASDLWAFYQAKTIRAQQYRVQRQRMEIELAERGSSLTPEVRQKLESLLGQFEQEEQRYSTEKKEIELEAKKLEQERDLNRTKDPYFDYAEVFLQIAIVMASVSILASSRQLFFFSLVLATFGALLTLDGFTLLVQLPFFKGGTSPH